MGGTSDKQAPGASPLRETLDEHSGCLELVAQVEGCLDRPLTDAGVWLSELRDRLTHLITAMRSHFESEEAGPLFRSIPLRHPRLADSLARLEAEHPLMLEDLEAVQRQAEALRKPADFELRELNARVQLLVARIRRHEAAENELLFDAHWSEIGVGD